MCDASHVLLIRSHIPPLRHERAEKRRVLILLAEIVDIDLECVPIKSRKERPDKILHDMLTKIPRDIADADLLLFFTSAMGELLHIGKERPIPTAPPIDLRRREIHGVQVEEAHTVIAALRSDILRRLRIQFCIGRRRLSTDGELRSPRTRLDERLAYLGHGGQSLCDPIQCMLSPRKPLHFRPLSCGADDRQVDPRRLTIRRNTLCQECPTLRKHLCICEQITPCEAHALFGGECLHPIQSVCRKEHRLLLCARVSMGEQRRKLRLRLPAVLHQNAVIGTLQRKELCLRIKKIIELPVQRVVQLRKMLYRRAQAADLRAETRRIPHGRKPELR